MRFSCAILCALFSSTACASGTLLGEATYANLGTAYAGTQSAMSLWSNPAVMNFIDGSMTTVSGTMFNLDVAYQGIGESATSNTTLPIIGFAHTADINDKWK